jgi:hypothetical protein
LQLLAGVLLNCSQWLAKAPELAIMLLRPLIAHFLDRVNFLVEWTIAKDVGHVYL